MPWVVCWEERIDQAWRGSCRVVVSESVKDELVVTLAARVDVRDVECRDVPRDAFAAGKSVGKLRIRK